MSKTWRVILIILFSLISLIIILIIGGDFYIKNKVKNEIKHSLEQSLNVSITIQKVEINWRKASVNLKGIKANTKGELIPKPIFKIGNIELSIDTDKLSDISNFNIKQILLSNCDFYILTDNFGKSNWNIKAPKLETTGNSPEVNINEIKFDNINVHVYNNLSRTKFLLQNINFNLINKKNSSKEFHFLLEKLNLTNKGIEIIFPRIEIQGQNNIDSLGNTIYQTNLRLNHYFAESSLVVSSDNKDFKFDLNSHKSGFEDLLSIFIPLDLRLGQMEFSGKFSNELNIEYSAENGFKTFAYKINFEEAKVYNLDNNISGEISGISNYNYRFNSELHRYDSIYSYIGTDSLKYLFNSKNTKNNYAHGEINLQNLNKLLAYENINISGNLHAEISRKKSNIIASDSILFVTKNKDTVLNINKSFLSFGAGISEWNFNLNNSGKEIFSNKGKITRFENKLSKTPELNLNFSISELIFEDKSLPKSIQLPKQSNEITNLPEFGIYYPQKFIYSISLKINKLNISNTQIKDLQLVSTLSDKEIDTQFKYNNNENNFQDLNISIKKLKNETNKIQIKNHSKFLFSDTVNYANIDNTTNLSFLLSDSLQITNNSINGSINFSTTGINIDNELIFSTFPLAKNLIDADIFKVSDSKIDIKIKDSNFEISPFDIKFYKLFMHGFGNFNPHDSVVDLQAFIILNPSHLNMIERKFLKSKALEQNFNLDSLKKGEILNLILKINGSIDKPDVKLIFKNHS